ncbi:MAG: hypothetical protein IJX36_07235 [Thermoguttaceae bacterium]|nr:hypothetical protein [Thermoguttaceae bacterium]MBQ8363703.1 hypothetical protein [Thermoguttaceae bacterium]
MRAQPLPLVGAAGRSGPELPLELGFSAPLSLASSLNDGGSPVALFSGA